MHVRKALQELRSGATGWMRCLRRDKVAVIHWVCVVLYGGVFYSVLSLPFHSGLLCYCIGIWNLLRDVMQ